MTTGMIIGRRRWVSLTHLPIRRRITCCSRWLSSTPSASASSKAAMINGRTLSKIESSSTNPRAWMSGPLMILAAWVLTTAITEMNPSSPRIRRSVSDVCEMSPTVLPSTKM